jgi:hypothetical protein
MRKVILLLAVILGIVACSEPVSSTKVNDAQKLDSTIIVVDTLKTQDTLKTNNSRYTVTIQIYEDLVEIRQRDNDLNKDIFVADHTFEDAWEIKFKPPGLIYEVRSEEIPEKAKNFQPFTLVDDYTTKANQGSTAELLCRYYDISMKEFLSLNPKIKNNNLIYEGKSYKIKECHCD